jgi:hypothetical protein
MSAKTIPVDIPNKQVHGLGLTLSIYLSKKVQ